MTRSWTSSRAAAGVVLAFRPLEEPQARVRELLARNGEGELSEDEKAELERFCGSTFLAFEREATAMVTSPE